MEVKGRIKKVLQVRSGVSQRTGNEWKALPFVVEFFENPTDRFPDSVVVETMDTNLMPSIREGVDVKIGISHHVREYEGRMYNEVRMYRFELIGSQQPADNVQAAGANNSPQPQQNAPTGTENAGGDSDDLPF
jgi:hypothetical protein